jgi:osmoprotectant transport system permease protein
VIAAAAVVAQVVDFDWIGRHLDDVRNYTLEHLLLTGLAVGIGFVVAFPIALLVQRYPRLYGPVLGLAGVLFTIPSLALFVGIIPFTGIGIATPLTPLVVYTLLILVRNTVEGLRSVPSDVVEAAEAMGYSRRRRLLRVELPLATPVIIAGLRIATVSTIGLVTITVLIGWGGVGRFFLDGFARRFATPLLLGIALSVLLSLVADAGLLALQRLATPWARGRR